MITVSDCWGREREFESMDNKLPTKAKKQKPCACYLHRYVYFAQTMTWKRSQEMGNAKGNHRQCPHLPFITSRAQDSVHVARATCLLDMCVNRPLRRDF